MKAYYDGLAKSREERMERKNMLKELHSAEADFYSVYVDSNEKYDKPISKRPGYKALMNAVNKGKINCVCLENFDSLNMTFSNIVNFIYRLRKHEVYVEVGKNFTSNHTEDELMSIMMDMYWDYLMEKYGVEQITFKSVYVENVKVSGKEMARVIFEGREKESEITCYHKTSLPEVTKKYKDGFFMKTEYDTWEFIDDVGVMLLNDIFKISYETLFESIKP